MDYGAFPPEFNSARMYAGAGPGPLLAAASAWDALAAELGSAASSYWSVISGLVSGSWLGPGSASMAAAAAPYAAWMGATAGQAEQMANQARGAAAAYEAAFAMTVPPPVIAANRAQLATLVATNFLGQNTPAIAATEAHYYEMWAQDAAAMYGYAASSSAVTAQMPKFVAPHQNTNPTGMATQAAVVAQTTGSSVGTGAQTTLAHAMSATPATLQGLASPLQSASSGTGFSSSPGPGDFLNAGSNLMSSSMSPMSVAGITQAGADIAVMRGAALAAHDPLGLGGLGVGGLGIGGVPVVPGAGIGAFSPAGFGTGGVLASTGRAATIGALSVPQSWASATPATTPAATASLVSSWAAAPEVAPEGMAGVPGMPGMPVAAAGGRGYGFAAPRYGFRPTVMAHPPAAG